MNAAIYARVSTDGQTNDQQITELQAYAAREGWEVVEVITDTVSGTKFTRAGLNRLSDLVKWKRIDVVLAYKLDRLARSVMHLCRLNEEFKAKGVALVIPGQGIDTRESSPMGRLMFNILGTIGEFERDLIAERTRLKLAALRAAGVKLGRPSLSAVKLSEIRQLRAGGMPIKRIAAAVGVAVGSVVKALKTAEVTP